MLRKVFNLECFKLKEQLTLLLFLDHRLRLLRFVPEIKNPKLAEMDEQSVEVCVTHVRSYRWRCFIIHLPNVYYHCNARPAALMQRQEQRSQRSIIVSNNTVVPFYANILMCMTNICLYSDKLFLLLIKNIFSTLISNMYRPKPDCKVVKRETENI